MPAPGAGLLALILFANGAPAPPSQPCTAADQAIEIADEALRLAIREERKLADDAPLTCGDMQALRKLSARNRSIGSLAGLEHATKIARLDLGNNRIADLTPLIGLEEPTSLILDRNVISDLRSLLKNVHIKNGVSVDVRNNCLDLNDKVTDLPAIETLVALQVVLEFRPQKDSSTCIVAGVRINDAPARALLDR